MPGPAYCPYKWPEMDCDCPRPDSSVRSSGNVNCSPTFQVLSLRARVYNRQQVGCMGPRQTAVLVAMCLLGVVTSGAEDQKIPLTEQHRIELIRTFNSDLVFIRTEFPMGKTGLTLKNGKVSPSGDALKHQLALWGPSVKPGDRAIITQMELRNDRIRFEINGGPVKKSKWYQHLEVGAGGGMVSPGAGEPTNNPRGSYVDLVFDHHLPDLTVEQVKQMLWPVFDFDAKSPIEAYLETVPPKVKEAIQKHHVLVGMNREMLIYAKGRPPKKIREKDRETEYEDWIYEIERA